MARSIGFQPMQKPMALETPPVADGLSSALLSTFSNLRSRRSRPTVPSLCSGAGGLRWSNDLFFRSPRITRSAAEGSRGKINRQTSKTEIVARLAVPVFMSGGTSPGMAMVRSIGFQPMQKPMALETPPVADGLSSALLSTFSNLRSRRSRPTVPSLCSGAGGLRDFIYARPLPEARGLTPEACSALEPDPLPQRPDRAVGGAEHRQTLRLHALDQRIEDRA